MCEAAEMPGLYNLIGKITLSPLFGFAHFLNFTTVKFHLPCLSVLKLLDFWIPVKFRRLCSHSFKGFKCKPDLKMSINFLILLNRITRPNSLLGPGLAAILTGQSPEPGRIGALFLSQRIEIAGGFFPGARPGNFRKEYTRAGERSAFSDINLKG